ncbi:hypothetical protein [Nocardia sp. AG03]|uniref:hypothetical protein n=1 Tax=Nocardia sp. AG03 TaxID=3025312 RepID=UPI002418A4E5|nr:hypothetical protein [Nocardia sp. AG03]
MLFVLADGEIRFANYPFAGASVYPEGVVPAAEIRDVDPRGWPPEIRTVRGETLFLPRVDEAELVAFCEANTIPVRQRPDVWSDLLEPFLDTTFDPEHERKTEQRLQRAGLSPAQIVAIRQRVERAMLSYNFDSMLWDWVNLGLFDLLSAAAGVLARPAAAATLGDPVRLYAWAMRVAEGQADELG